MTATPIEFVDPFVGMDRLPAPPPLPREIRLAQQSNRPLPFDWDTRDTERAPPPDVFEDEDTQP